MVCGALAIGSVCGADVMRDRYFGLHFDFHASPEKCAGVAIGGAFSLIRFRSAQGSAEEITAILIAMGAGIAFGMGYLAYGLIILVVLGLLYFLFSSLHLFDSKPMHEDKLL